MPVATLLPPALDGRVTPLRATHPLLQPMTIWAVGATGLDPHLLALDLPVDERQRIAGAPSGPAGRARAAAFGAGRVALRALLDTDAPFSRGDHGRPFLPDGRAFGVSYCGTLAVIAAGAGAGWIGVDVDDGAATAGDDPGALARDAGFTAGEVAACEGSHDAFLRVWTMKEALAKAAGTGIGSCAWSAGVRDIPEPQYVSCAAGWGIVAPVQGLPGHQVAVARWSPTAS